MSHSSWRATVAALTAIALLGAALASRAGALDRTIALMRARVSGAAPGNAPTGAPHAGTTTGASTPRPDNSRADTPVPALPNEDDTTLTSEDRAEITRDVLNREITRRREEESKFRTSKKAEFQIILSTLNIKSELVPKLTDVTFLLMTPNDIEAKMAREGRVHYLVFSEFRVEGSKVRVTLLDSNQSRRARAFVSSQSFSYEYSHTNGKWAGKLLTSGMLIS
jgi:hypothetical protein